MKLLFGKVLISKKRNFEAMKTPRAHKSRSKHGRKLGKITLDTERSICDSFGKELKEVPGHFMYNEENDAIQQVLKLPDISVNDGSEHNDGGKRGLSLPPICGEDKGANEYIKHYGSQTKLPKINTDQRNNSVMNSCWLEKHDVSTISWKKALDVLDNKARDCGKKKPSKESVKKC